MKPKYFEDVFNVEPSDMKYSVWQLVMVEERKIKNKAVMSHCVVPIVCGRPLNQLEYYSREFFPKWSRSLKLLKHELCSSLTCLPDAAVAS